jgi:hypothetical protein
MTDKEKTRYDDYPAIELVDTVALWGACYGTYCKESGSDSKVSKEAKAYLDLAVSALKVKIKELDRLSTVGMKTMELMNIIKEEQNNG